MMNQINLFPTPENQEGVTMNQKCWLEDTPVWIRSLHLDEHGYNLQMKYQKRERVCPLCRFGIIPNTNIYRIITNYKLFPNTTVHEDCVKAVSPVSLIKWRLILKRLKHDWEKAEKSHKHNRCWYG